MNVENLSEDVLDALRGRGLSDAFIEGSGPEPLFDEYCSWQGLIGYGPTLIRVLDELRKA